MATSCHPSRQINASSSLKMYVITQQMVKEAGTTRRCTRNWVCLRILKPWVCFGDSNHRFSEITHAGITICLKVANLWQIMYDGVRSVNTHGVVRNDANRCSVANLLDEIVRINNPTTKWSFFKEESTGANNNNKKKITEKNKESRRLRKDRSRRPKDDYVPSGQSESGDTTDSDS